MNRALRRIFALILICCASAAWGGEASPTGLQGGRIAVLPVDNLSGSPVPLRELRGEIVKRLAAAGIEMLDEGAFERFLYRHRVRYTGGLDSALGTALRDEERVAAVLIVNLELYMETSPPKVALMGRLVSTGPRPEVLWMEAFSLAGHENPGLLGLGQIDDLGKLRILVINRLCEAVADYLGRGVPDAGRRAPIREFPPHVSYGRELPADPPRPTVAVLPFFNESGRKYANEILLLHFVRQFLASGRFRPVEPGVIREKMLAMRIIMQGGISLGQADLISNNLETDYVLSGKVFDYLDTVGPVGAPKVDFSVQMFARFSREIVWSSKSYNSGDEGVWFYDLGRIYLANTLAAAMANSVVSRMGIPSGGRSSSLLPDTESRPPHESLFLMLP